MKRLPVLIVVTLLLPSTGLAFDSRCYKNDGTECAEGYETARNNWIGDSDEHRRLLRDAIAGSGIPTRLFATRTYTTYVGDGAVGSGFSTVRPVEFEDAKRTEQRRMTVAEFAQLPDFSYSLADWVTGNERCPLDASYGQTIAPELCHAFAGHMGAANSNHFLPQAEQMYLYYHQLALDRASKCKTMIGDIPQARAATFSDYTDDCQREALILEAIGQHFLQDAWSTGHMWERWGSPNLSDFPDFVTALAVASVSGLIHGAGGLLRDLGERLEVAVGASEFNDAMCAPHPEVKWVGSQVTEPTAGVGDLYSSTMNTSATYSTQNTLLFSCSIAGLRAVYKATGEEPLTATFPGLMSIDPTSAACFDQRVSNEALLKGFGLDATVAGMPKFLPLTPTLASQVLFVLTGLAGSLPPPLDQVTAQQLLSLNARLSWSLTRVSVQLNIRAILDPNGDTLARGGLAPLAGVKPNGDYASASLPTPYVDPALPWTPTETSSDKAALARAFHRAHADLWCDELTTASLMRLRQAASTADAASKEAACSACVEFVQRHVRLGDGPGNYDTANEPLCHHLSSSGTYVYESTGTSHRAAAGRWCGCTICPPTPDRLVPELSVALGADIGTAPMTHEGPGGPIGDMRGGAGAAAAYGQISVLSNGTVAADARALDYVVIVPVDPMLDLAVANVTGSVVVEGTLSGIGAGVVGGGPCNHGDEFYIDVLGERVGEFRTFEGPCTNRQFGRWEPHWMSIRTGQEAGTTSAATVRWIGFTSVQDANGNAVPHIVCSASGTQY